MPATLFIERTSETSAKPQVYCKNRASILKGLESFDAPGLFKLVKHQIDKYNIYVKILVKGHHYNHDCDKNKSELDSEFDPVRDEGSIIRSEYLKNNNVELQFANELDTRMLTIIADREKLLTVEIQDNSEWGLADLLGLATYSNSINAIMSYYSVFETSWVQSQIRRNQK